MEDDTRKTKKFCHYRGDGINLEICSRLPQWKISNDYARVKLKVCDEHLAWGIRQSGYPALIDIENEQILVKKD